MLFQKIFSLFFVRAFKKL